MPNIFLKKPQNLFRVKNSKGVFPRPNIQRNHNRWKGNIHLSFPFILHGKK